MTSAVLQLQAAVRTRLLGDATLVGALGGDRVFDGNTRNVALPFVSLDDITSRRRDGVGAVIEEHRLTLRVWSKAGGKAEALSLADRIVALLEASAPVLANHLVIHLACEASETRHARDRVAVETLLRFKALTQPVP